MVEIVTGCVVTVSHLPSPFLAPASAWARQGGNLELDWLDTTGETCKVRVCGFSRCALQDEWVIFQLSPLLETGSREDRTTQRGRFLPLSSCFCSYSYGQGTAVGPLTGGRCWSLLSGLWRAIAPLDEAMVC